MEKSSCLNLLPPISKININQGLKDEINVKYCHAQEKNMIWKR